MKAEGLVHFTYTSYANAYLHSRFQTRASPGIAQVKFWSIILITYHYIVLWDNGADSSDSKDNRPV